MKNLKLTKEMMEKMDKAELITIILQLQEPKARGGDMKKLVYNALLEHMPIDRQKLASVLNTTPNNISSYLTYLRNDGIEIGKNAKGQLLIIQ